MSERESVLRPEGPLGRVSAVGLAVLLVGCALPFFAGCASMKVHLGMRVALSKVPVASIELQQAGKPGIGPGQKSSLIATVVESNGKTLLTEGAGHGKVMWRDLTITPRVVTVNKKGVVALRHDPRASAGQLPHVTAAVASHLDIHADLDIPLRYDYAFRAEFSGSRGAEGSWGSNGQDGTSGSTGSTDPDNPMPGGNGGDGSDGGNGQDGGIGGDAPPVQIQMTLAPGTHPLLEFAVVAPGHTRHYLVDPQSGSLTVVANGGPGGPGGKAGRGGRGGSGGAGTPPGVDGRSGLDGHDGMAGPDGRGGLITVSYDTSAEPYLGSLHLSSSNGPKPVMREEAVPPLW